MFDLPDAKRIRRSDLNRSRSSSPSSNTSETAGNAALLQAKLAAIYGPIEYDIPLATSSSTEQSQPNRKTARRSGAGSRKGDRETNSDPGSDSDSDDNDVDETARSPSPSEHEYAFSLFRKPTSNATEAQPQTIILSSSPGPGEGRILNKRPLSYFIAEKAAGSKKEQLEYAAVSGEDVLEGREKRAWGLEVRWRVRFLKNGQLLAPSREYILGETTFENPLEETAQDRVGGVEKKKHKPNKKRRIHLRVEKRKEELADESRRKMEEYKQKLREEKEEAAKEKKTRLNREKKIKRKMKEKMRKAEAGGGAGGVVGGEDGDKDMVGKDGDGGSDGDSD